MGGGVTVDWWSSDSGYVEECGGWVEERQWMGGGVTMDGWRSDSGWV